MGKNHQNKLHSHLLCLFVFSIFRSVLINRHSIYYLQNEATRHRIHEKIALKGEYCAGDCQSRLFDKEGNRTAKVSDYARN